MSDKTRSRGRAPLTRATRKLYARLGLTPEATDQEVETARAELVGFLEGAPDGARRWARNEMAAIDDAHAALTSPDRKAAAGRSRGLRRLGVVVATLAITVGVVVGVYEAGGGGDDSTANQAGATEAGALSPGDQARVARLMKKLDANPKDSASLVALGDIFFKAGDYKNAGSWMEQAVKRQPGSVKARLALGAAKFNLGDVPAARGEWERVVSLDSENVEAYYDLGFLYLSKQPPNMAKAKQMWRKVVELAPPESSVAKTVTTHLKSLENGEAGAAAPSSSER